MKVLGKYKKFLSILLVVCLLAGVTYGTAFAQEEGNLAKTASGEMSSEGEEAEEGDGTGAEEQSGNAEAEDGTGTEEEITTGLLGSAAVVCSHGNNAADCVICKIETMISGLPTVDEISAMGSDEQLAVYAEVSNICDAYDELADAEQGQVSNIDTLWDVLDYFSGGISLMAADGVSYIDENGDTQTCTDYISVTNQTTWGSSDSTTWYVVDSSVKISTRITVSGTVNLILVDACTLTASKGITVSGSDALNIYGQKDGTGTVTATGGSSQAGIGGNQGSGGNITINGGTVTATGGLYGAGIGSGSGTSSNYVSGSNITINGGTVTATGKNNGAGIGGGRYGNGSDITINGGMVTATGGSNGAGIGSGSGTSSNYVNGSNITISGGTVTATGGNNGAGIGGGQYGNGSDITINDGMVTATGGGNGAGIGGGNYGNSSDITINNGMVTATGGSNGAGIGGGQYGNGSAITISSGTVTATGGARGAGIGSGSGTNSNYVNGSNITINGGTVIATGKNNGAGIGGGNYGNGSAITISDGTVTAAGGGSGAGIGGGNYGNGSAITISSGTVTATGGGNGAGIGSGSGTNSNYTLGSDITISGGTVDAAGGSSGAGIGGGLYGSCSNITISGGTVDATGGTWGAGIGSGKGASTKYAEAKDITISGGYVIATADTYASAIGAGQYSNAGTITITGGYFGNGTTGKYGTGKAYSCDIADGCIVYANDDSATKSKYPVYVTWLVTISGEAVYGNTLTTSLHPAVTGEVSYQWRRGDDDITGATGSTYTLTADDVGKEISVEITYNNANDTAPSDTVTVEKATLTASLSGSVSKTYDGTAAVSAGNGLSITLAGTVNNETPAVTADYAFADVNVGTGKTINAANITLTSLDDRYTLSNTEAAAAVGTITQATPAVTLSAKTETYTGSAFSIDEAAVTLVNSETYTSTITYTYYTDQSCTTVTTADNSGASGDGAAPKNAGTYYVKASIAAQTNYSAAESGAVCLQIEQKTAELTWTILSSTELAYDGTAKILSAVVSNLVTGDNVSVRVALTGDNTNVTAAGFYYTATELTGDDSGNYCLPTDKASPTYQITAASLTASDFTVTQDDQGTTVTLDTGTVADINFTQSKIEPVVSVVSGSLVTSNDYGVTYGDNTAVGTETGTVTITGKGNFTGTLTYKFNIIDTEAPTGTLSIGTNAWAAFWNTVTFGLFFKNTQTVTVSSSDNDAVDKTEYYLADTAVANTDELSGVIWTTYDSPFSINPNNKYVVYAKITDNSGNSTIINSNGVVLYTDSAAGTTNISFTRTDTGDVTADVTLNGNTVSGISCTGGSLIDSGLTAGSDYSVDVSGTITFKNSWLETLAAGAYTLTVSYNPQGETYVAASGNDTPATTEITLTVSRATGSVTITNAESLSKTYDGEAAAAPAYSRSGTGNVTITYKVKGADDSTYSAEAPKDAGSYTVRVTAAADDDYAEASATADFTISKKALTVTADNMSITYGDPVPAYTVTCGGFVDGEDYTALGGSLIFTCSYSQYDSRGEYSITPSGCTSGNYDITFAAGKLTVNARAITVEIANQSSIYGDAIHALTAEVTSGNTVNGDTGVYSLATTAGSTSSVGSYDITGTVENSNYDITFVNESDAYTVTARELTVAVTVANEAYDVTNTASVTSAVLNNIANNDIVTLVNGTPSFDSVNVGNNISISFTAFTLSGDAGVLKNYTLTQPTGITTNITNDWTPVSGTEYTVTAANANGWLNTDFVITAADGYELSTTNTAAGTWASILTAGDETANGTITFYVRDQSTGAISLAVAESYKIDKTAPAGRITVGAKVWQTLLGVITFGRYHVDPATVTIDGSDSLSGVASVDYYISDAASALTADDLAALAAGSWKTYDPGNKPDLGKNTSQTVYARITDQAGNVVYISSDGLVVDTAAPAISDVAVAKNPSNSDQALDVSFQINEAGTYYYVIQESDITAPAADKVISDKTGSGTVGSADLNSGTATVQFTISGLTGNTNYTVYIVMQDDVTDITNSAEGTAAHNTSEVASGSASTDQTTTTVTTAPTLSGTYGDAVSQMAIGENGVVTATPASGETTVPGTWTVTDSNASDIPVAGTAQSYELTFTPADSQYAGVTVSVTPAVAKKSITAIVTAADKTYDGTTAATVTAEINTTDMVNGDSLTISGLTGTFADKNAGTDKAVTVDSTGASVVGTGVDNYSISYAGQVTADITARALTIAIDSKTGIYGDAAGELTATVSEGTIADGDENVYSLSTKAGKTASAGVYDITGTALDDNYNITFVTGTYTITARELTVTVVVADKQYDGTNTAVIESAVLDNVANNDDITLKDNTAVFGSADVGNGIAITFAGDFVLSGEDSVLANYTLIQPTGVTADITNDWTPASGTEYTVTAANANGWLNTDFVITAADGYELSADNTAGGTWTSAMTAGDETADGTIIFYVRNQGTGAISLAVAESYKIDKTAPTGRITVGAKVWQTLLGVITFGRYHADPTTVTVDGSDSLSGVASLDYYISAAASALTADDLAALDVDSWKIYDSGNKPDLGKNTSQIVYARITDQAGNVSYISSDGIVIDTIAPTISDMAVIKNSADSDQALDVSFKVNEAGTYYYVIQGSDATAPTADTVISKKTGSGTVESTDLNNGTAAVEFTISGLTGNTAYTVYIVMQDDVTDISGSAEGTASHNTSEVASGSAATDQTATTVATVPTLSGTYGDSVSQMVIGENGVVTAAPASGETTVTGTWAVTDSSSSDVPVVGTTNSYELTFTPSDSQYASVKVNVTPVVSKKSITAAVTAADKTYDGTATAAVTAEISTADLVNGDSLTVSGLTGTFEDKNAGTDKIVTVDSTAVSVTGTGVNNYSISYAEQVNADITARELTVTVAVADKAYDGTNTASITSAVLNNIVNNDIVTLVNGTPAFDSVNAGTGINISFTDFSLSGEAAVLANYILIQPTGVTAGITNDWTPVSGTEYTVTAVNANGWLNTDFIITAADGYELSATNTADGTWASALTAGDETADGIITFYVRSQSTGAISLAAAESYKIDKTAPAGRITVGAKVWQTLMGVITFGRYHADPTTVTVDGSDSLSGVASVDYYISAAASALTADDLAALAADSWKTYGSGNKPELGKNTSQTVYVRITDQAGNVSYISSDGIVIDTIAPTISDMAVIKNSADSDQALDVSFKVNEAGTYYYVIQGSDATAPTADTVISKKTGSGTVESTDLNNGTAAVEFTISGLTGNTAYTVYIVMQDDVTDISGSAEGTAAHNTSEVASGSAATDQTATTVATAPTLSGTYGDSVSQMVIGENGVVTAAPASGETTVTGTWALTDSSSSDVPVVGTTNFYELTFTPSDSQYASVRVNVTPAVAKKSITVTVNDVIRNYGASNPSFTFTLTEGELADGDTEDDLGIMLAAAAKEDSATGSYAITGTSDSTNYDVTIVDGTLKIVALVELPDQDFPDDLEHMVSIQIGITDVPEALQDNEELNSVEKIEAALHTVLIEHRGYPKDNMVIYEVTLMVSSDGGATWKEATAENFPEGGLTITLPYPDGTGKETHDFAATHMFTTTDFGNTPGDTENPAVTKTDDGIQVTVTGLSPIAVAWNEIGDSAETDSGDAGKSDETDTDNSVNETDKTDTDTAQTSDNAFPWLWAFLITAGGFGILYAGASRRRKRR